MRLFTAVTLPDAVKEEIESICIGLPYVRWVKKDQLHITLCFLGEVDQNRLQEIQESLSEISFDPFSLQMNGVGQFLTAKDINAVWLGVQDEERIVSLQKSVSRQLRALKIPVDKKKYKPHLTLARIKRSSDEKIREYMQEFSKFHSHPFTVDSFQLISSRLYADGPVHTVESVFPLQS